MSDRRSSYQRRSGAITKAAHLTKPATSATSATTKQRFYAPATPEEGAALLDELTDEATFQAWVIDYAKQHGWRWWHDNDSRRNKRGLPDLLMVRGSHLIFAELKTERGTRTPEQREWLADLLTVAEASHGAVNVYLWRPSDMAVIERILA